MLRARTRAEISLPFDKKSDAEAFWQALSPETATSKTNRASVRVTRREKVITMRFFAKDLVALRAMVNSYLRLAATWRRVAQSLDGQ